MNNINLQNAVLVTHAGCCDGSTCAVLFVAAGGRRENVYFSNPNNRNTDELVGELVASHPGPIIIADISVSVNMAKQVHRNDVVLLDHHKSSIPLTDFRWCEIDVDNSRCGSMMLYHWLKEGGVSLPHYLNLVRMVDDNDRWIHEINGSQDMALFHDLVGSRLFINRFLLNPKTSFDLLEQYALNIEVDKRESFVEDRIKNVQVVERNVQGHTVRIGFVQANNHQSVLGNTICSRPELNIDIAVLVGNSISMRASETCPVDLSEVAKQFGGGGHKKSSGMSLDRILGGNLIEIVKDFFIEKLS